MKKRLSLFLFLLSLFCLLPLSGCENPDTLQLDLSRGYGEHLRLLHINASSQEKRELMERFAQAIREAEPLEKDFSMFAYYPDYQLEITPWDNGKKLTVIVDLNGDFVDFYYPGSDPEAPQTIYRSHTSVEEFKKLVHHI